MLYEKFSNTMQVFHGNNLYLTEKIINLFVFGDDYGNERRLWVKEDY